MVSFESGPTLVSTDQLTDKEREQLANNLSRLGEETKNNLTFVGVGEHSVVEQSDVKEEIRAELNSEDLNLVRHLQKACYNYLTAPTFTDDFHNDHASRRLWESNYLKEGLELNYYKTNRLGTNFNDSVFGLLRVAVKTLDHKKLADDLSQLLTLIPTVFLDRNEEGGLVYDSLPDDKKIEVSLQVADLAREILKRLEDEIIE